MILYRRLILCFTAISLTAPTALAQTANLTAPPSAIDMVHNKPAAPHAHTPVTNLNQALRAAFIENPGLRAERASLRATQEEYPQAFSNFLPTLSWDFSTNGTNVRGDTIDGATDGANTKEFAFNFDQPIFNGGANFAELSEAKNNISAAEAALIQEEQDIFLDVVTAYMNVIRDRRTLSLQKQNEDILRKRLSNSEALFEAGELTRTDVSQSRARLSDAQSDLIEAELDLNATIETFVNLTGRVPALNLEFPSIDIGIPETLQDVQETSLNYNPNIIEARHEHLAARSTAQAEYGALLPQVSLNAGYKNQIDPGPGNNKSRREQVVGIQVSVPFFQGGAQRSEVREAKITANQYKLEMMQAIQDVMEDTANTWQSYQSNGRIIELRRVQVQAARDARDSVFQEVEAGERTYIDLLDSDQGFLDAELNLLLAEREAVLDAYRLLTYMGQLNAQALDLNSDKAVYTPQDNMNRLKDPKGYMTFDPYEDTAYPLRDQPKQPGYVRKGRAGTLQEIATPPEQKPSEHTSQAIIEAKTKPNDTKPEHDIPKEVADWSPQPVPAQKPTFVKDNKHNQSPIEDSDFDREFEEFYKNLPSAEVAPVESVDITEDVKLSSSYQLNSISPSSGMDTDVAPIPNPSDTIDNEIRKTLSALKQMRIEKLSNEYYLNATTFDNYHMAALIAHELQKEHGIPTIIAASSNGQAYSLKAGPYPSEKSFKDVFGTPQAEKTDVKETKKDNLLSSLRKKFKIL